MWVPKQLAMTMPGYPVTLHESQRITTYPPFSAGLELEGCVTTVPWDPPSASTSSSPHSDIVSSFAASPADPRLADFDVDMALQLDAYLRDAEPLGIDLPLEIPPAMGLFDSLDFTDADLFSGPGLALPVGGQAPFTSLNTASPESSAVFSPGFSITSNSPPPCPATVTPASASPAGSSPDSTTSSSPSTNASSAQCLPCAEPSCPRTFTSRSDLRLAAPSCHPSLLPSEADLPSPRRKHERRHRLPFRCDLCGKGHLEKRGLARHLWARHAEYARQHNTPSERVKCELCDYAGRRDNVIRHMKRHAKSKGK